jgi:hypothetical protein
MYLFLDKLNKIPTFPSKKGEGDRIEKKLKSESLLLSLFISSLTPSPSDPAATTSCLYPPHVPVNAGGNRDRYTLAWILTYGVLSLTHTINSVTRPRRTANLEDNFV